MASPVQLQNMAADAARRHGLPEDVFLSLIRRESNWDPAARSPKGAAGLGQFMPATWKAYGGGANVFDPAANLDASARYLSDLYKHYGYLEPALAAYNGGPKAGAAYQAGRYTNRETAAYVPAVMAGRSDFASFTGAGSQGATSAQAQPWWMATVLGGGYGSRGGFAGGQGEPLGGARGSAHLDRLEPGVLNALTGAAGELKQQGIDLAPFVTSGFRTGAQQKRVFAKAQAGESAYPAAPPGTSNHEQGLAVDIDLPRMRPNDRATALSVLQKYGLSQPDPLRDPIHFEQRGSAPAAASEPGPWWMGVVLGPGYQVSGPPPQPPRSPVALSAPPTLAPPMEGPPVADRVLQQTGPMVDRLLGQ